MKRPRTPEEEQPLRTAPPRPLQNRVTPHGAIVRTAERYPDPTAMFGNRGVLHDDRRNLVRQHRGKMWLSCRLRVDRTRKVQRDDNRAFNGRKRTLMAPRRYTELFFLDEPTSMAAGHRPCACCRRADFTRFLACWRAAHPNGQWTAGSIDAALHDERLARRLPAAAPAALPDGTFVLRSADDSAWLKWRGRLHRWTHGGYVDAAPLAADDEVRVLTPSLLVATLAAGFEPNPPHASAGERASPVDVG